MTHSPQHLTMGSVIERLSEKGLLDRGHLNPSLTDSVEGPPVHTGAGVGLRGPGLIGAVTADSRMVQPGSAFVAIEGSQADGHQYIATAISSGSSLVISERPLEGQPVPVLRVSSARKALAEIAAAVQGDPSADLAITAVTGTNGKTTTAWLIAQALSAAGTACGFLGTIGYGQPGRLKAARHTTPGPVELQRNLAALRDDHCEACALEASSHAIDQDRLWGIAPLAAVFTNLTRDHLDYHLSFSAYLAAKAKLFDALSSTALAVTNADDPNSRAVVAESAARVSTYGMGSDADVRFAIRSDSGNGLLLRLDGHDAQFRLAGAFNAYNLAAAYLALEAYGLGAAERVEALAGASGAPGRFEILKLTRDRVGVVDYAHTPDALQNVLEAARAIVPVGAQLWCVFGCGGDRDGGKRPMMGALAEHHADKVVVTSDNPRTEDALAIMSDIRQGVRHPEEILWIEDRRSAIRCAIESAGVGDVVVVAGKGHETYQVVGTERHPFSDLDEIRWAESA